jgi:hypothetical protein
MICPYCGKENPENTSLCAFCGGRLFETDDQNLLKNLPPEPITESGQLPAEPEHAVEQSSPEPELSPAASDGVFDQPAVLDDIVTIESPQPSAKRSKRGCDKYLLWFLGCFVILCLTLSCVALLWGFYNFSTALDFFKPATPTSIPSPTSSLLFYDDFSNPDSGWPSFNETDYVDDYYNDAYRMIENVENTTSWVYPSDYSFADVSIEVDATKNGGSDENDMGVICRYQDDDHFYFGLIASDGYYGVIKMADGEFSVIGGEYLESSDSINQGSATNHIRMDCVGDVLTLYVNGQQLMQQTDADFSQGNVGLLIGAYETPGTDILYDNFIVQQP